MKSGFRNTGTCIRHVPSRAQAQDHGDIDERPVPCPECPACSTRAWPAVRAGGAGARTRSAAIRACGASGGGRHIRQGACLAHVRLTSTGSRAVLPRRRGASSTDGSQRGAFGHRHPVFLFFADPGFEQRPRGLAGAASRRKRSGDGDKYSAPIFKKEIGIGDPSRRANARGQPPGWARCLTRTRVADGHHQSRHSLMSVSMGIVVLADFVLAGCVGGAFAAKQT